MPAASNLSATFREIYGYHINNLIQSQNSDSMSVGFIRLVTQLETELFYGIPTVNPYSYGYLKANKNCSSIILHQGNKIRFATEWIDI